MTHPYDPHLEPVHHRGGGRRWWPLLATALGLLALVVIAALWNGTGSRGVRADLEAANERVVEKRRQVAEAQQVLEQRVAELREAEAAVVAENERLDAALVREEAGDVDDAPSAGEDDRKDDDRRRDDRR